MRPPSASRRAASRMALMLPFRLTADGGVDESVVGVGEPRQLHDAGVVDEDVNPTEGGLGGVEHARYLGGIGDVGPVGDGAAAGLLDLGDDGFRGGGIAGVVHDDDEAITGQSAGGGGADAARGSGDDGDFVGRGHGDLPLGWGRASAHPMDETIAFSIFG